MPNHWIVYLFMSRKGAKAKPKMTASLEEIVRKLVEEQAQRETDMTRRKREVQAQMTTIYAAAYGITLASSE